jgi:hypothetical protein
MKAKTKKNKKKKQKEKEITEGKKRREFPAH